jgi:hypothetical protein
MFRSTDVRFGIECGLRKGPTSKHAARDAPAACRVFEITGKFPNERTPSEASELQTLLSGSAEARRAYVEAMILQAELQYLFTQTREE